MPRIPIYTRTQGLPAKSPGTLTIPGVAAAPALELSQFGAEMQRFSAILARKYKQAEQFDQLTSKTTSAAKELNDLEFNLRQQENFSSVLEDFERTSSDLRSRYNEEIQDAEVKKRFTANFDRMALAKRTGLQIYRRNRQTDAYKANLYQNLEGYRDVMVNLSGPAREIEYLDYMGRVENDVEDAVKAGIVTEIEAGRLLNKFAEQVDTVQAGRQVMEDPEQAYKDLMGNEEYRAMDPMTRLSLAKQAESRWKRLQREAEQEQERANRIVKARLRDRKKDDLTSLATSGEGIADILNDIQTMEGDVAVEEHLRNQERSLKRYAVWQDVLFASPQEAAEKIEAMKPQPGTAGYADAFEDYEAVSSAYLKARKQLENDPVAYVMQVPEIQGMVSAASAISPGPQRNLAMQDLAGQIVELQSQLGVPEVETRVLTNAPASQYVARFNALPAEQRAENIRELAIEYGPHFDRVFADLVRQKLPPEAEILASLSDTAIAPQITPVIAEAINQGRTELKKALSPDDMRIVQEEVAKSLGEFQETVMAGDWTGGRIERFNQIREVITLAAFVYAQKMNAADAAERAADEIINSRYHYRDMYRVPREYDADVIEDFADERLKQLEEFNPIPHGSTMPELTDEDVKNDYLNGVKRRGAWVTNEDETGLILLDYLGLPVVNTEGKRFGFRFDEPFETF